MIRPVEPVHHAPRPPRQGEGQSEPATAKADDGRKTTEPGRMLVTVASTKPRADIEADLRQAKPSAAFVAQLLAMRAGDPQTRVRRQIPASESATRYADVDARPEKARSKPRHSVTL